MVPGVGAVTKGMSTATRSLTTVEGLTPALASGGRAALGEITKVAEPAAMWTAISNRVASSAPELAPGLAKTMQNTVDLGVQAPVVINKIAGTDATDQMQTGAGYVGGAEAAGKGVGDVQNAAGHASDMGGALRTFSRALG
jgi:hypothetical protein